MRGVKSILAGALLFVAPTVAAGQNGTVPDIKEIDPATADARVLYKALDELRPDSLHVYFIHDVYLRRGPVNLTLGDGKLAFFTSLAGRVTGAVYVGRGHVIATPREASERLSMAHFLKVPLLDESFSRAYFRFTDDTAAELERDLKNAGDAATAEPGFGQSWNDVASTLNPWHSRRILFDWLSTHPQPYFYAGIAGDNFGVFDVVIDARNEEQVFIGQPRVVSGESFYDVWASYALENAPPVNENFVPLGYTLDTTIGDDLTLTSKATLDLKAVAAGERVIPLELSRYLVVDACSGEDGSSLEFFQNPDVGRHDLARRGNDRLLVVLRAPTQAGQEIRLKLSYRGSVISDAGNGVYFVGQRGSWYPHPSGPDQFVSYDLTFHWPRRLTLVATGKEIESQEEGERRTGHWVSKVPAALAGFNLGNYASQSLNESEPAIDLYANQQLEDAILARLKERQDDFSLEDRTAIRPRRSVLDFPPLPPPSPKAVLAHLGNEILDSIRFFEKLDGAFPFDHLDVSPIPGRFGQGWPGLLYLPTLVFLPRQAQQEVGAGLRAQQEINQILPFHEVAHQWWGNVVGVKSYRDDWIQEAMANYLAIWYGDAKRPAGHLLATSLEEFRDDLLAKPEGGDGITDDAGSLTMGYRLDSSRSPAAYNRIIYGKGTWVIHMLRMMLRDPGAKEPDARFQELLHYVLTQYRFQPLSTEEFEHAADKYMTPAMDLDGSHTMEWFFDEWVRETGIPRYSVEFSTKPHGDEFVVSGKLKQAGVPDDFTAAVPLYIGRVGAAPVRLGTVTTGGPETRFHFVSHVHPAKLIIDPNLTVLCKSE
jgi:hypothetical protein